MSISWRDLMRLDDSEVPADAVSSMTAPVGDSAASQARVRVAGAMLFQRLSPGGRYLIDEAFCRAVRVSSTVSKAVV